MTNAPPVVALFGATALGKSDVAREVAARLEADIVVADSMQIYAGLPIVTNQPSVDARAGSRYHLVGWASPQDECTVAEFATLAHGIVDGLLQSGRGVVVEGGSGLYLRAVLGDLTFGAAPDEERRRALEERWQRAPGEVAAELSRRAPDVAARTDLRNGRRVIRALEALEGAGDAGDPQTGELWSAGGRYAHRLIALVPDDHRAALKERIDRRVDEMLAEGALDEVATARASGPFSRTAAQAIGVRELCAVLDGEIALEQAAARMKTRTRALARRQLTWLRKLPDAAKVPSTGHPPAVVAQEVLRLVQAGSW